MAKNKVINTVLQLNDKMSDGLVRAANKARGAGADISKSMVTATAKTVAFKNKSVNAIKGFASTSLKASAGAATALTGAFFALDGATEEYRVAQGKLNTAFESAGLSAKSAQSTYSEFYAILGDTDTATEASQLLAKLTQNEKDLSTWTRISAGVSGTFGDSLPIEGLIESANETAKVGQVTGSLADALNWAGISEDKFNKKLEACSSESERNKLIMNTLSKEYNAAADAFYKNNEEVTKSRKYQAMLARTMGTLGEASQTVKNGLLQMLGAQEDGSYRAGSALDLLSQKIEDFSSWVSSADFSSFSSQVDQWVTSAVERATSAISWFKNNSDSLIATVKVLAAAFVSVKILKFGSDMIDTMRTISGFIGTIKALTAAKRAESAAWIKNTATMISNKAGLIATNVASKAAAAGTSLLTGAQKLLNLAFRATPIGWIVTGIGLIIAAGVALYKNWDEVKEFAVGLWNKVKEVFGGIKDAIVGAFETVKKKVGDFFGWLDEKMESIPILGQIWKGGKAVGGWIGEKLGLGGNVLGTSYWKGGLTRVNERGGEIMNLPNGTQIIPHDVSRRVSNNRSVTVNINVQGNIIGNKEYAREMGDIIVNRLIVALDNY